MDPRKLAFWSDDPQNRYNTLLICRNTPTFAGCAIAKQSLLTQAGEVSNKNLSVTNVHGQRYLPEGDDEQAQNQRLQVHY